MTSRVRCRALSGSYEEAQREGALQVVCFVAAIPSSRDFARHALLESPLPFRSAHEYSKSANPKVSGVRERTIRYEGGIYAVVRTIVQWIQLQDAAPLLLDP